VKKQQKETDVIYLAMVKNTTRISSLLGTWTGQTRMKALVGPYSMEAYFIVHLMPDPLRGYGCQQDKCTELENHVCVEHDDRNTFSTRCVDLQDGEIAWSDGACCAVYSMLLQ
jgi:hypothetical protein